MWKKIHTFYIAIATLLTTSMFFCSFATIIGPDGSELKIMYYEKLPYLTMLFPLAAAILDAFAARSALTDAMTIQAASKLIKSRKH